MPKENTKARKFNNEFAYAWDRSKGDKKKYAVYFYLRGQGLDQFEAITSILDERLLHVFCLDLMHGEERKEAKKRLEELRGL